MGALPMPDPFDRLPWEADNAQDDDDQPLDLLLPADTPLSDQLALDALIDAGFSWEVGLRLLVMRANIAQSPEVIERLHADPHLRFIRWLYQQGRLTS